MAAHRYWRIRCDTCGSNGGVGASTVQFFDALGVDLTQTAGGTPFASSYYSGGFIPDYAFDNNSSTQWASGGGPPQNIGWDFGAGNDQDIVKCGWYSRFDNSPEQSIYTGGLEYSDDGVTYTETTPIVATLPWSLGQGQNFETPTGLNAGVVRGYMVDGPSDQVFAAAVRGYMVDGPFDQVFAAAVRGYIIEGPPGVRPRRRSMRVL